MKPVGVFATCTCLALILCNVQAENAALLSGIIEEVNGTALSNDTVAPAFTSGLPSRPRGSLPSRASIRARQAAEKGKTAPDEVQISSENVLIENDNFQPTRTMEDIAAPRAICPGDDWYSDIHDKCYDKFGYCPQYDYTDPSTCINANDDMLCQWNTFYEVCDNVCATNQWYSQTYALCYDKSASCWQYDGTDAKTCMNKSDKMVCTWNEQSQLCDAVCSANEWYSSTYGKCYDKNGGCDQYHGTDAFTCTNPSDNIICSWDSSTMWCDPL
ncbi:hypothetical protein M9434_001412 [Picochlorum sp. BPE23]|nr:hypothetical protein M9434_001412 [Picochlorum sp. BPE23]